MNFEVKVNKVGLTVSSSIPCDTYGKYLGEFLEAIRPTIPNDKMVEIIKPLLDLKSWRLLNREVRKACNQYCYDNKIMSLADFQEKYFYESVMLGRTMYGKNAPWVNENVKSQEKKAITVVPKKTVKEAKEIIKAEETTSVSMLRPSKGKAEEYDLSTPWGIINKGIADRIAADQE